MLLLKLQCSVVTWYVQGTLVGVVLAVFLSQRHDQASAQDHSSQAKSPKKDILFRYVHCDMIILYIMISWIARLIHIHLLERTKIFCISITSHRPSWIPRPCIYCDCVRLTFICICVCHARHWLHSFPSPVADETPQHVDEVKEKKGVKEKAEFMKKMTELHVAGNRRGG